MVNRRYVLEKWYQVKKKCTVKTLAVFECYEDMIAFLGFQVGMKCLQVVVQISLEHLEIRVSVNRASI